VTDDPTLPADSDVEAGDRPAGPPRPAHLSWPNVGLVAAGGTAGTGLRFLISRVTPTWAGLPVAIFAINVVGAFLLGLLLERLAGHDHDVAWSRRLRLAIGTGVLGGFTTYSALATDTAVLDTTHPGRAAGYALGTVVVGAIASTAGIAASRRRQPSSGRRP
jgi:fluoride exporter